MTDRPQATKGFTVVELLVVILIIAMLIAILLPALARAREAARTVSCANNERNLGLGIFQYAERYGGMMPTAYYNLWNRLALYVGEGTDDEMGNDIFRCGSDQFLIVQGNWAERNQCSYGANADETGVTLASADEAGWRVEVPPGSGNYRGAQYSPFTAWYKEATDQCTVKLNSVATDTVLLAECWRDQTVNSLFLNLPDLTMCSTDDIPDIPTPADGKERNSLLLEQYTATAGGAVTLHCAECADIDQPGVFNFMIDVAALGSHTRPHSLEDCYHMGRMNVLYADGHVEAKRVKFMTQVPGPMPYPDTDQLHEIPYWNRYED